MAFSENRIKITLSSTYLTSHVQFEYTNYELDKKKWILLPNHNHLICHAKWDNKSVMAFAGRKAWNDSPNNHSSQKHLFKENRITALILFQAKLNIDYFLIAGFYFLVSNTNNLINTNKKLLDFRLHI